MTTSALKPPKAIGYRDALDKMGRVGTRLVKMRADGSPTGFSYYLVPGGYVEPDTAEKLKKHPFCRANEDGLFPGHDQTWTLMSDTPQGY